MRDGEAVLQAVRSAGVLGYISTNGADGLRRWVGCVEISPRSDTLGHMRIDDSRFNHHQPVGEIYLKDSIHARQANDHAALGRKRAPAQPCARSAAHERNLVARADADNLLNCLSGARQDDRGRHYAKIGEAVALVGLQLILRGDEAVRSNGCAQFIELEGREHSAQQITRWMRFQAMLWKAIWNSPMCPGNLDVKLVVLATPIRMPTPAIGRGWFSTRSDRQQPD
jgi:hypothetical protein